MTQTEPGYPEIAFPFGWQGHQWLKKIHRGDMFGMPGRWFALIGGVALVYLSVSGIVMYFQMWTRRKQRGRPAFVWR
jgi:uncharacterized iron-regulated membrane protein